MFGIEIKVVDEAGATLPRDGMSQGELMVRGQWIVSGYYKAESSPLVDGWFPTGDIATIDANGRDADPRPHQGRDQNPAANGSARSTWKTPRWRIRRWRWRR